MASPVKEVHLLGAHVHPDPIARTCFRFGAEACSAPTLVFGAQLVESVGIAAVNGWNGQAKVHKCLGPERLSYVDLSLEAPVIGVVGHHRGIFHVLGTDADNYRLVNVGSQSWSVVEDARIQSEALIT